MRLGDQVPYVCCGDGIVNAFRKQVAVYFDICQQIRMALERPIIRSITKGMTQFAWIAAISDSVHFLLFKSARKKLAKYS